LELNGARGQKMFETLRNCPKSLLSKINGF
jgi:hypothetical protein